MLSYPAATAAPEKLYKRLAGIFFSKGPNGAYTVDGGTKVFDAEGDIIPLMNEEQTVRLAKVTLPDLLACGMFLYGLCSLSLIEFLVLAHLTAPQLFNHIHAFGLRILHKCIFVVSFLLSFAYITCIDAALQRLDILVQPFVANPFQPNAPLRAPLPYRTSRTSRLLQTWWNKGATGTKYYSVVRINCFQAEKRCCSF